MKNTTFLALITITNAATGVTTRTTEEFNFYPNALSGTCKVRQAYQMNSALHTACVTAGVIGNGDLVSIINDGEVGVIWKTKPEAGYNDEQRFTQSDMMCMGFTTVTLLD